LINTGSIDAGQIALATGAGVVGGGLGYSIEKGISKIWPRRGNAVNN
jgi:hypothetical protein